MTPEYADDAVTLYAGDCFDVLRELDDCSVDAVVTDPPYGLEFMGKGWDSFAPDAPKLRAGWDSASVNAGFSESMNGGTLPAYGKRRSTWTCPTCTKRDGFRNPHACGEAVEWVHTWVDEKPLGALAFGEWCLLWATEALRVLKPGGHLLAFGGTRTWHRLACAVEDAGFEVRDSIAWLYGSGFPKSLDVGKAIDKAAGVERERQEPRHLARPSDSLSPSGFNADGWAPQVDVPVTPDAVKWDGWGTALKPAFEPIVVARKPLTGTVASNVLLHGTGALNIDANRVGDDLRVNPAAGNKPGGAALKMSELGMPNAEARETAGRWPSNVLLEESQTAELDRQSGTSTSPASRERTPDGPAQATFALGRTGGTQVGHDDFGGASRYFPTFRYESKAPTIERPRDGTVAHPTVKPLDLMRWLVRLVTPPGGLVLDPFAGSGTTAEACIIEGFRCVTIERDPTYLPLILARIRKPIETVLF